MLVWMWGFGGWILSGVSQKTVRRSCAFWESTNFVSLAATAYPPTFFTSHAAISHERHHSSSKRKMLLQRLTVPSEFPPPPTVLFTYRACLSVLTKKKMGTRLVKDLSERAVSYRSAFVVPACGTSFWPFLWNKTCFILLTGCFFFLFIDRVIKSSELMSHFSFSCCRESFTFHRLCCWFMTFN